MEEPLNTSVLVTSASAKVPLIRAVKAALIKRGNQAALCWAGDVDSDALARYIADDFWLLPNQSMMNLNQFVQGCRERSIGMVIPTRDGELEFWAQHKNALHHEGIEVFVSPLASVKRCLDKLAFSIFSINNTLPSIPTANSIDELPETRSDQRYTVKERFGAGSHSIGLNLSYADAKAHADHLSVPLYQPYVTGRELSVDAWMDAKGTPKGVVMRWRDKVVNGESQVTTTFTQSDLESQFLTFLEALDLRGPAVLQAIVDSDNCVHIIECNSRFGGASTLSIAAGLDSFYWSFLEAQGVSLQDIPYTRIQGELRQIRVPNDELIHDSSF